MGRAPSQSWDPRSSLPPSARSHWGSRASLLPDIGAQPVFPVFLHRHAERVAVNKTANPVDSWHTSVLSIRPRNTTCCRRHWRDILVHMEKVAWIVGCFDRSEALPSTPIGLGNAIAFIATHKIDVNSRNHSWPQLHKQGANPRNICSIVRRV